jgi:hypothetical protein
LNTTTTERGTYWHIHLVEAQSCDYALLLPKRSEQISLSAYKVDLTNAT